MDQRNYTKFPTPDLSTVVEMLSKKEWMGNPNKTIAMLLNILALLKSKDLNTYKGKDFLEAMRLISELLKPISHFAKIAINENVHAVNGVRRPLMVISNDKEEAELIARNKHDGILRIPKILVHGHIDVREFMGKYGGQPLYIHVNRETISGRAVQDMLGQIAALIMFLYMLESLDLRDFCITFTSTEELGLGHPAFEAGAEHLVPGVFNFDAEATSGAQMFTNEIIGTSVYVIGVKNPIKAENLDQVKKRFEDCLKNKFRKYQCDDIKVSVTEFEIQISFPTSILEQIVINKLFDSKMLLELISILRTFGLVISENGSGYTPGFKSHTTGTAMEILNTAFAKAYPNPIHGSHDHLDTGYVENPGSQPSLKHNFGTYLTYMEKVFRVNTFIASVRELGRRHSANEEAYIDDFLKMLEFYLATFIGVSKNMNQLLTEVMQSKEG